MYIVKVFSLDQFRTLEILKEKEGKKVILLRLDRSSQFGRSLFIERVFRMPTLTRLTLV